MKPLLSFLFSLTIALSSFGQNGVYLYGFMQNAPSEPIAVNVSIFSDSSVTNGAILFTDPSGNIPTQWVDLPEGYEISWILAEFTDCTEFYTQQSWGANEFDNLIDIPINLNYCQDSLIYGCTDPEAINYNPNALFDDGSCEYATYCDLNDIYVTINTNNWGYEVSWDLITNNSSVASGGNYDSYSSAVSYHCVPDGCYTFELHDTYGDGWNGSTFKVVQNGNIIASGTLNQGNFGTVTFGINQEDCPVVIYGCTDPLSQNYNPTATADDGTCAYSVVNDICADALPILPGITLVDNTNAIENVGIWGECWGFGQGEGEQTSVWYTFTTPDFPARIHLEALYDNTNTLTDTQFGIFEECGGDMIYCDGNGGQGLMSAFNFECGDLAENTTYILMIDGWMGNSGTCLLKYTVDSLCTDPIYGCTDPESLTYNPDATEDDGSCQYEIECDFNAVQVVINTQLWAYEISWDLLNADNISVASGGGYDNNIESWSQWCLEDGCYTFLMYDTIGDGWNGSTFEIFMNGDSLASGTLSSGYSGSVSFGINQEGCVYIPPVYGCTDPEALNYNPNATEDNGSCEYLIDCDLNAIQVVINAGPWANEISWELLDSDSISVASGSGYNSNIESMSQLCLEDGCYTFLMYDSYGDGWNGSVFEVFMNGESLAFGALSNGFYGSVSFGINQEGCVYTPPVYGCTDPEAINYNPDATENDGSCVYPIDCDLNGVQVIISTEVWGSEISWNLLNADSISVASGIGYANNMEYLSQWCLNDGCYTFEMFDAFGDGWNGSSFEIIADGEILASGTLSGGNYGFVNFGINQEGCIYVPPVYGCTDPNAYNYNPDATEDDGSCFYQYNCSIDFLVIPDSLGADIIWILPSNNIFGVTEILWDFGDGTTSTELFPQHEYIGDGPFTLCVTASFQSPDSSTCSITYCAVLSGDMVGGSVGFMSSNNGFSINVINSQEAVGINEPKMFTNLSLWPNPSSDQLNIKYHTSINATQAISIMDITGKTLMQDQFGSGAGEFTKVIDVSDLPSGVYLLRLSAEDHLEVKRFVIAK